MKPDCFQSVHKVFLITGANGTIGKAMALALAADEKHEVVLVGRDMDRLEHLVEEMIHCTGNPAIRCESVDLSRKNDIFALAERWQGLLHVLVNNAAASPRQRHETPEGIEVQFATNVLGYFWMIQAFEEILRKTCKQAPPTPRIINVASYWAGDLDLDDLEFKHRSYNNDLAYRQSKQANIMLTTAFSWRLAAFDISVNTCHPGDAASKLSSDLGFGGSVSAEEAADTPVWLATSQDVDHVTGKYFERRSMVRNPFLEDRGSAERLFQICQRY